MGRLGDLQQEINELRKELVERDAEILKLKRGRPTSTGREPKPPEATPAGSE